MDAARAGLRRLAPGEAGARAAIVLPATKFVVPRARPEHLLRRRTLGAVDGHAPLLLVRAPAGYGKTTLLGQWLARRGRRRAAWVTLAAEDDGEVAFWTAVASAVERACPGVARRSLQALAGPRPEIVAGVLAPIVDELCELGEPLDLALDDLHLVADPTVHAQLGWLVEHAPAGLRVAIATRHRPALALGRMRARGGLSELLAGDLRFDADEAERLLDARLGLGLGRAAVESLADRLEGWPAGLALAGLRLRGDNDGGGERARAARAFGGDDALVADYLVPELLAGLDAGTRAFLRRTAILDALCAPLCDAVAGGEPDAAGTLAELERTGAFLVALDGQGTWSRYARPFAELLRAQLHAEEPALAAELHRRASRWHEAHGDAVAAAAHARERGDAETAAGGGAHGAPPPRDRLRRAAGRAAPERLLGRAAGRAAPEGLLGRAPGRPWATAWPVAERVPSACPGACDGASVAARRPSRARWAVEPLSVRELEVLRMLAGTLSLPAIAGELYVTHNTIKTHARAIYRKLGVGGRGAAVARARELGLR